ncbi:MAG: tyrosine-type recombinase/integrase [Nanoarchaeota archaeon]
MALIELMKKEMLRRNYSLKTIESYKFCISKFLKQIKKEPKQVTKKDIKDFLDELIEKGKSGNTINVYLNALKFVFEKLLGKKMKVNIKYAKKPLRLPSVLEKEEVIRLFGFVNNKKHKLMLQLMYSAGLRVSELLNLKVEDIRLYDRWKAFEKRQGGFGFVRQGKGRKDRIFIIAERLNPEIKELIGKERLNENAFLFQSNRKKQYSTRTVQEIIKKAKIRAKIDKKISPHTLRHSFATHLIENGYDLFSVQSLLGHKSPETTMVYIHLAAPNLINIKSPFDSL